MARKAIDYVEGESPEDQASRKIVAAIIDMYWAQGAKYLPDALYKEMHGLTYESQLDTIGKLLDFLSRNHFSNSIKMGGVKLAASIPGTPEFVYKFIRHMGEYLNISATKKLSAPQKIERILEIKKQILDLIIDNSMVAKTIRAQHEKNMQPVLAQVKEKDSKTLHATRMQSASKQKLIDEASIDDPSLASLSEDSSSIGEDSSFKTESITSGISDERIEEGFALLSLQSINSQVSRATEQEIILHKNCNKLIDDLLEYIKTSHAACIHLLNKIPEVTNVNNEIMEKDVWQYANELATHSREIFAIKQQRPAINTPLVEDLLNKTTAVVKIVAKVEDIYKKVDSDAARSFAAYNSKLVNIIVAGFTALLELLIKIRDELVHKAPNSKPNKNRLPTKKTYTTSHAGTKINTNAITAKEQEISEEFLSIAKDIKSQSAVLQNKAQSLLKDKQHTAIEPSVYACMRALDPNKQVPIRPSRDRFSTDVKKLVDNLGAVVNAGDKLASIEQTIAGKQPTKLLAENTMFAARMMDRIYKLTTNISQLLYVRGLKPMDPTTLKKLDAMKHSVLAKAMNIRDRK